MIYKSSLFLKEFRQSYIEDKISRKRMLLFGIFLGLLSFSVHFMLQTVYESVLTETVPEFMMPSYFSVLYTYTIVSTVFFIIYFLVNYQYLTFNEINLNKWYALIKHGYNPLRMIMAKIFAVVFSMFIIYTTGFLASLLFTSMLKYHFVYQYFPSLYLSGFIDIILIIFITMSSSIYIRSRGSARYFTIGAALLMLILKVSSGFYGIVSNRVLMQNISNMMDIRGSLYIPIILLIFCICLVTCIFGAKRASNYYKDRIHLPEGIVIRDFKTGEYSAAKDKSDRMIYRYMDYAVNIILVLFITATLALNLLIIMVSVATPDKEISIKGIIPYVFQSTTMEPTIEKNDLAYFSKIDEQFPVDKGDIVLFKDKERVFVERITAKDGKKITVDIDNYPPMSQIGAMIKEIDRSAIYGIYYGRNRWLGALILFANTIFGRILLLLVPTVLVFFYKPITEFIKKHRT